MDCSFLYCPPRTLSSPLALQCLLSKLNVDTDWVKNLAMLVPPMRMLVGNYKGEWRWREGKSRKSRILEKSNLLPVWAQSLASNLWSDHFWPQMIIHWSFSASGHIIFGRLWSDHFWPGHDHFWIIKTQFWGLCHFLIFSVCISLNASFYASQHSRVLIFCPTSSQSELLGRPYIGHGISPLSLAHRTHRDFLLQLGQMHFEIWTNTFWNSDKYILKFREIYLAICQIYIDLFLALPA